MVHIDLSSKYTITNVFFGSSKALSSTLRNDSLIIVPIGSGTGTDQLWYFTETNTTGRYRLHTVQKGDFYAVDISSYSGQNSITVHFVSVEEKTGQYWAFDTWEDGSVRISNDFTGPDIHLGVDEETLIANIFGGDNEGQHWRLDRLGPSPTVTSAATTVLNTSIPSLTGKPTSPSPTSCASSTSACSVAAATAVVHDNKKKLSTGSIVGVTIGGVFGLVALIASIILYLKWRERRRRAGAGAWSWVAAPMVERDG
ncbi:hypothetical protein GQ43DRAFT_440978 [Delitschia confertaspora ATCC 74209]|uniref:Ricin B lectin domain-containing protein n=1 Tax=Delitschia confertaspora ATCC 74209 TaxID=1513339 RepID=A0A9P4JPR7_9PLEO|nr:hypothetical protein GQ43DRAFT_440978 [Delitschia confertaspora ATCC 74209]